MLVFIPIVFIPIVFILIVFILILIVEAVDVRLVSGSGLHRSSPVSPPPGPT